VAVRKTTFWVLSWSKNPYLSVIENIGTGEFFYLDILWIAGEESH
jgi:hypothetical protein